MNSSHRYKINYTNFYNDTLKNYNLKNEIKEKEQTLKFEMQDKKQNKIKSKIFGYNNIDFEILFPELKINNYIPIDLNGDQIYDKNIMNLESEINGLINSPRANVMTSNNLSQLNKDFLFKDIKLNRILINNKIINPSHLDSPNIILDLFLDLGIKNMSISLNISADNMGSRYVNIYFSNIYNTWRIYDHDANITEIPIVFYQEYGKLKCNAKDGNLVKKTYNILKMDFEFNSLKKNINLQNFINNYKTFIDCRGKYWKLLLESGKSHDISKFSKILDKIFNFTRNFVLKCTSSKISSIILDCN